MTGRKQEPSPPPPPAVTAERAAQARRDAYENVKAADRGMVDALLAERRGYQLRDQADRVAQVDAQLALRGYQEA